MRVDRNFLRTVIANNRLAFLPEIAAQFKALANSRSWVKGRRGVQRFSD
jgi:F0F1-type ATP synthase delta subunit